MGAAIETALKAGAVSIKELQREGFKSPACQVIEVYHKSVLSYPQIFHPQRMGLAANKTQITQGLDATRMGYAANLYPITMAGLPFEQEAFLIQDKEGKRGIAVNDFKEGKLLYNATKLTTGEAMPATILSQGPQTPETVSLFIKLLIEANVTHIVALGMLRTAPQFYPYWPKEEGKSINVSGATIKLVNEQVFEIDVDKWQRLFKRTLQLEVANVGTRQITQYHWEGYNFPDEKPSLKVLDSLQRELLHLDDKSSLLLHCHDGMARSSLVALTFFAMKDIERQKGKEEGEIQVNPLDLAFRLYSERPAVESTAVVTTVYEYLQKGGVDANLSGFFDAI
jgi:hypothetical protein